MPSYPVPICLVCKHYHYQDEENNRCDAYAESIPFEILTSVVDHTRPYPGDNGIRFEPIVQEPST